MSLLQACIFLFIHICPTAKADPYLYWKLHHIDDRVSIVLAYTEAWLRGVGCIPLNHHMEDAATAEISRVQIWQWKHHGVKTEDDGVVITAKRISSLVREEVNRRTGGEDKGKWFLAGKLVSISFVLLKL
jgi:malate synthase